MERARDRWYTETIITPLQAAELAHLTTTLSEKGWALSKGGRFFTVQSARVDKGKAVRWLQEVFRQNMPEKPVFAATGDSPNDAPMLAAVDFPFLVRQHSGSWADVDTAGLIKIDGTGPAGFAAAVKMLLGE
jgi:HAD superfamily hydrolase (TIGR01484 family)